MHYHLKFTPLTSGVKLHRQFKSPRVEEGVDLATTTHSTSYIFYICYYFLPFISSFLIFTFLILFPSKTQTSLSKRKSTISYRAAYRTTAIKRLGKFYRRPLYRKPPRALLNHEQIKTSVTRCVASSARRHQHHYP
jgi:hypothetical protein